MIVIQDSKMSTVVVWVSTIVIFLLLGLVALMAGIVYNKKSSLEAQLAASEEAVEQEAPATAAPKTAVPAQPVVKPAGAVNQMAEARPVQPAAVPAVKTIYVLINGKLVPLEIAADQAQMVESDLAELKRYAPKPGQKSEQQMTNVNPDEVKRAVAQKKAVDQTVATENRVVLSQDELEVPELQSNLQQVAQIALYQARKKSDVRKLVKEAEQHEKQMRLIRVRPGDSLWTIAVRAYGNGFKYKKILEANPQIKDPRQLAVGMMLRVPE